MAAGSRRRLSMPARRIMSQAAVAEAPIKDKARLEFPFIKLAGQDDMKLALLLNVVDPNIGGVLIMGDRGTGKSVAVSGCRWAGQEAD